MANAFEKMKGGALAHNLVSARQGKSRNITELDENFWKILGGSIKDVKQDSEHDESEVRFITSRGRTLFSLSAGER